MNVPLRDRLRPQGGETSEQSAAKYRGLLEAAPDAMVVVNQAGEIVLLNVQAEKQFGYRRDELLGQPVTNIIPEGFAERLIADDLRSAEDALAQQIGTGIELTALRKDGSEFPIEIMLSPLESAEGILVTAAIRDISVRRAADQPAGPDGGPLSRPARGGARRDGRRQPGRRDRPAQRPGREAVRLPPRRAPRPAGHQHHPGGLRRAADRRRPALGRGRPGPADRDRHRADRPAQGRQRVPDRDHAQPARERRGHPRHRRHPRHQRPPGRRAASWPRWRAAIAACSRRRPTRWSSSTRPARSSCSTSRPRSSSATAATSSSASRSPTSSRRASPSG